MTLQYIMTWRVICRSSDYVFKSAKNRLRLDPNKCEFMIFLEMILGFIISKEGKLLDPKKIQAIVNIPPPKNPQQIQVFNGMALFYRCFIKNFATIMAHVVKLTKKT